MSSYKLKITLCDSETKVTRTLSVPKDITFRDLHGIIQVAMGWRNTGTYVFEVKSNHFLIGPPRPGDNLVRKEDDRDVFLSDLEYRNLRYIYDSADDWVHDISFLKDTDLDVPKVLKYTGECPPEGCGGIEGYEQMRIILSDPENPEYPETRSFYDRSHIDYDMDAVNEYLANDWVRYDPTCQIPEETFNSVIDAMGTYDGKDRYLDPESMCVVTLKAGSVPESGLLPISLDSDPVIVDVMREFLGKRRSVLRKVGMGSRPAVMYKRFIGMMRKDDGLRHDWNMHSDQSLYERAVSWAESNGFELGLYEDVAGHKGLESLVSDFMGALMGMSDERMFESEEYLCPRCGTPSKAALDRNGRPTPICGTVSYPAKLWCRNCRTHTVLRKLNDGFYVGFTYEGWHHPCRMVEPVLRRFLDAINEPDPIVRFDRCAALFTALCRLSMTEQYKTICKVLDDTVLGDDPIRMAVKGIVDSLRRHDVPARLDREVLEDIPRQFAALYASYVEDGSEDFQEVEELHAFMRGVFDSWEERDADYFELRKKELLCYTMDERPVDASGEMVSLLREAVDSCRNDPAPFDDRQWQMAAIFDEFTCRLWELGFNDRVHEMVSVMGDYLKDDGQGIPYSVRSIYEFRRGLVEMSMGGGIDVAKGSFETVIDIHRSMKDAGPLTVFRSLISHLILYRYGAIDRSRLAQILSVVPQLFQAKIIDREGVVELTSYAMYALMHDMPFKDAKTFVSDHTSILTDIDEAGVMELWDGDVRAWEISLGQFIA